MATIDDYGKAADDTLAAPPLGGPDGWAAAVAAELTRLGANLGGLAIRAGVLDMAANSPTTYIPTGLGAGLIWGTAMVVQAGVTGAITGVRVIEGQGTLYVDNTVTGPATYRVGWFAVGA
jgi:hypothetical protein